MVCAVSSGAEIRTEVRLLLSVQGACNQRSCLVCSPLGKKWDLTGLSAQRKWDPTGLLAQPNELQRTLLAKSSAHGHTDGRLGRALVAPPGRTWQETPLLLQSPLAYHHCAPLPPLADSDRLGPLPPEVSSPPPSTTREQPLLPACCRLQAGTEQAAPHKLRSGFREEGSTTQVPRRPVPRSGPVAASEVSFVSPTMSGEEPPPLPQIRCGELHFLPLVRRSLAGSKANLLVRGGTRLQTSSPEMTISRLVGAVLCVAVFHTSACSAFAFSPSTPISLSSRSSLPQRCIHNAAQQPLLPARERQGCARLSMAISDTRTDTVAALKQEILAVCLASSHSSDPQRTSNDGASSTNTRCSGCGSDWCLLPSDLPRWCEVVVSAS